MPMQLPYVQTRFLDLPGSFPLRNGAVVEKVRIAYEQYGVPYCASPMSST